MSKSTIAVVTLLVIAISGCNPSPTEQEPEPEVDSKLALSFIKESGFLDRNPFLMLRPDEVKQAMAERGIDPAALRRSAVVLLQDQQSADRRLGAALLGSLQDFAALPALTTALATDPDPDVRWTAAQALPKLGPHPEITAAMVRASKDSVESVRLRVVWSFSFDSNLQSAEVLRRIMREDASRRVRVEAASGLTAMKDRGQDVLDLLCSELRHDSVRAECEVALERVGQLRLPLPEECYHPIDRDRYAEMQRKVDGKSEDGTHFEFERSVTKDGKLYFEFLATTRACSLVPPSQRRTWFVVPVK